MGKSLILYRFKEYIIEQAKEAGIESMRLYQPLLEEWDEEMEPINFLITLKNDNSPEKKGNNFTSLEEFEKNIENVLDFPIYIAFQHCVENIAKGMLVKESQEESWKRISSSIPLKNLTEESLKKQFGKSRAEHLEIGSLRDCKVSKVQESALELELTGATLPISNNSRKRRHATIEERKKHDLSQTTNVVHQLHHKPLPTDSFAGFGQQLKVHGTFKHQRKDNGIENNNLENGSHNKGISKEKAINFINEKLGFEYTPSVSLSYSDNEKGSKRKHKEERDSVTEGNSEKKLKGISPSLFQSSFQANNNYLPPRIEKLLNQLEKELDNNPEYKSIVEKRIFNKKTEQQRLVAGKG